MESDEFSLPCFPCIITSVVLITQQTLCTYLFREIVGAIMNKYFKLIFNTSIYTNNMTLG